MDELSAKVLADLEARLEQLREESESRLAWLTAQTESDAGISDEELAAFEAETQCLREEMKQLRDLVHIFLAEDF